jgi:MoxR-like ATPase
VAVVSKTQNVFTLLRLLQTHKTCTGKELAAEMQTTQRTIYRYKRELCVRRGTHSRLRAANADILRFRRRKENARHTGNGGEQQNIGGYDQARADS